MSLLVVGLSHRSAPVDLLERTALADDGVPKLLADISGGDHVDEALVLATCNRLEVYADVRKFHGGVQELTEHLYVHYEDRAVQHLFAVASGLDSMVVGEQQILGQLRIAVQVAREEGTVGRIIGPLVDSALRAGKRVHTETGIDRAGRSLVSVGLEQAERLLGPLAERSALLVGAGSMSALAATTLRRRDIGHLTIANRTPATAERLASALDGRATPITAVHDELPAVDLLVSCTGAVGTVISAETVAAAMRSRPNRPLFILDLALPRDVEMAAREVPGVTVVDLEALRDVLGDEQVGQDVESARHILTDEVAEFLTRQRSERVAPTVAALRARAQAVVDAELTRLSARLPELDERAAREVAGAVARVVDKLLHTPTVRAKELAGLPSGESYAEVLRELFALDPAAAEAVTRADVVVEDAE